ncbi:MAG: bifunctional pyr operon transcriptional regulator/uracil phosphoribosyltransferase PyrR [Myxococcales bacterium]|nr:MAG: bifunctional pyr operon transcriptional regulator/uracil phosphoribosyltransferase PyrR [Myxococcales bacterium]
MSATRILDEEQIARALRRIAHEIVERTAGAEGIALVGIRTRGVPLAERLAGAVEGIEGNAPPVGAIDVSLYRDDVGLGSTALLGTTELAFDIHNMTVVLVDDVLYTGRTVRSAMDALIDLGRPSMIQLAVLVDRGHRELPIRADYVGKNIPTSREQNVLVKLADQDGCEGVFVEEGPDG